MKHIATTYIEDGFEIIKLKNERIAAKIAVNIGNTLVSLMQNEEERIYFPYTLKDYQKNKKLAGNPFMHPWANRLQYDAIKIENQLHAFPSTASYLLYRDGNDLPLHGLLLKSNKWKTITITNTENSCYHIAEFIFDDDEFLSIFPFKHTIQIKHELIKNSLVISTTIINQDEKIMPVSFGFHPYFLIEMEKRELTSLTIPAAKAIEVNDKMIPTGNYFTKENKWNFIDNSIFLKNISFDEGFQDLYYNEENVSVFKLNDIEILMDTHFPVAQIYAPKEPEKPYVCIEPMTAITNALNTNNCTTLNKNQTFSATFSIVI
jgi:galactose mutarotase-like enzyme